jgi:phosphate binding protein
MTTEPEPADVLEAFDPSWATVEVLMAGAYSERPVPGEVPTWFGPDDRYQLRAEIGLGGMGVIYEARDRQLGRLVAVKVLKAERRGDPACTDQFVREARISGWLQHPAIIPVHELGRLPDGRPYLVMKRVQGETLADLLARQPTAAAEDRRRLLGIVLRVSQALAYAHARQVIHRDLTPRNIMVGDFGEVLLLDWGLAKLLDEDTAADSVAGPAAPDSPTASTGGSSRAGLVKGTPCYMAPEQARGQGVRLDARGDVFGLGAVLCHVLTGEPPFIGSSKDAILAQAAAGDLTAAFARLRAARVDGALRDLVERCLAPNPEDRPADASVVARELSAYLASVERRLRAVQHQVRVRRLQAFLLVLVILCGGSWVWFRHRLEARAWETRLAAATRELVDALGSADALLHQTREQAPEESAGWANVRGKADTLRSLLATGAGTEEARRQAEERLEELDMLGELAAIVPRRNEGPKAADPEAAFADVFRRHDLDVDGLSATQLADRARGRYPNIAAALAMTLGDWAVLRAQRRPEEGSWEWLSEAARQLDPDTSRSEHRGMLAKVVHDWRTYQPRQLISGECSTAGSDTMRNLLAGWCEGFREHHAGVRASPRCEGSATAVPALIDGTVAFGAMSRAMNAEEIDRFRARYGYSPTGLRVAGDALVLFVNPDNPLRKLTLDQLRAVFGEPVDGRPAPTWGDLGLKNEWADQPINLYGRNTNSGTQAFFKDVVLGGGCFRNSVKERSTSASVVQGVARDRYGMGYVGVGYLTPEVRAIPLARQAGEEPVKAGLQTADAGTYPLTRDLYLYVNSPPGGILDPVQQEFLRYVYSRQGQTEVLRDGYFPVDVKTADRALESVGLTR